MRQFKDESILHVGFQQKLRLVIDSGLLGITSFFMVSLILVFEPETIIYESELKTIVYQIDKDRLLNERNNQATLSS